MDSTDRVWVAREVCRHLTKAIKLRRLYGSRHAHASSALGELTDRMRTFHSLHDALWLEVGRDALLVGETAVLEDTRELPLAYRLFVGGARRLGIRPEVEPSELDALVTVLAATGDDADPTTALLEKELAGLELVCLDELVEGWDIPENLSALSQRRIDELNKDADAVIEDLSARQLFGAGDLAYELTDAAEELAELEAIGHEGLHDPDDSSDEGFALPAGGENLLFVEEARCLGPDATLKALVEVVLDGLVLARDELPLTEAQWFLAEAPVEALRREDLSLLAWLLERYRKELATPPPPEHAAEFERVADAIEWAFARLDSAQELEHLVKVACGAPIGGPAALCRVARAMGRTGTSVVCRVYARSESQEVRDALNAFLADQVEIDPAELARLCAPSVPTETARWALFTAGKHLKGDAVDSLFATAQKHPDASVRDYASFLWRTQSPQGRLQAFLDTLASPDPGERLRALGAIAQARDAIALEPIKKLVDDASFLGRSKEERAAFLSAVAAIAGTASRGFLMRQKERPTGVFQRKAALEVREEADRAIKNLAERLDAPSAAARTDTRSRPRPGALRIRGDEPREGGRAP